VQKDNKNAYVLFEKKEEAQAARLALNQTKFLDKHIRVDATIHEAEEG
jgi:RNA recognition motif-containing protein